MSDPSFLRAWLVVGLVSSIGAAYFTYVTLEAYGQMPSGLGRSMPSASEHLLRFRALPAILPLLVLGVWQFWPERRARGVAAAIFGIALFILLPGLVSSLFTLYVLR